MKSFIEFQKEEVELDEAHNNQDEYDVSANWSDKGTTHKRWDKDHDPGTITSDRHQSTIRMRKERGKDPVYHASHRIEKGYWTNQSSRGSPTSITHKSEHSSFEDAHKALKNHTNSLYKIKNEEVEIDEASRAKLTNYISAAKSDEKKDRSVGIACNSYRTIFLLITLCSTDVVG